MFNFRGFKKLDINVNKIYLAYINKDYVFEDNLNIEELFILTDEINGNKFLDIFSDRIYDFKSIINRIEATSLDSYSPKRVVFVIVTIFALIIMNVLEKKRICLMILF